mgnify:CR=1 FL=1|jgi:uncharacterized membrane protein HdeD (DUF308 family)
MLLALIPSGIISMIPLLFKETYRMQKWNRRILLSSIGLITYSVLLYNPLEKLVEENRTVVKENIHKLTY